MTKEEKLALNLFSGFFIGTFWQLLCVVIEASLWVGFVLVFPSCLLASYVIEMVARRDTDSNK